jgi:hypothetical protein
MKPKFYSLLFTTVALFAFTIANASPLLVVPVKSGSSVIKTETDPLSLITAKQFLSLTPKKYQELTGKKMNLFQKIEFKMLQHKVKGMVKRGEVVTMADVKDRVDELSSMNVLGFLLGLVLGPVGVVIALILKETGNVDAGVLRWSLYGLLVWLAIVLVAILI